MSIKKFRYLALVAVVAMLGTTSCLKDPTPSTPDYSSAVAFVLASPTGDSLDIYDGSTKLTGNGSIITPSSRLNVGYFDPGSHLISFKTSTGAPYPAESSFALNQDSTKNIYTVFMYDNPAKSIYFKEDFSDLSTTKANIRFYNLCQDMPAVDLYIGNTMIGSATYPESLSEMSRPFTEIDAAYGNLTVKLAGTDSTVAGIVGVQMGAGYVSNIILTGKVGGTGNTAVKLYNMSYSN